jgi:hypothetical protein
VIDGVTACLVTRGDQPANMRAILATLVFSERIVWDNSRSPADWKCAGRYLAATQALRSGTRAVYFQDDDVIVPRETQEELVAAYLRSDVEIVANWGHGDNPDGYEDLPLVCGGAVADPGACIDAMIRYAEHYPLDEAFKYEADFAIGVLYDSFEHLRLPFEIDYEIAQAPERLCNQPWQKDLKRTITNQARAIRDGGLISAAA